MNDLQTAVEANAAIENIYFNELGQWIFFPNPDFPQVKTRDEVLAPEAVPVTTKK